MRVVKALSEMQREALRMRREGRRIGLVPTMGFLHEGHLSLIRRARPLCDRLVVSLFVNPTQFGPSEDLAAYPRDFERDAALCAAAGVDILFAPAAEDMYRRGHSVYVDEGQLARGLCGAFRPGHFRGVLTVVAKLFNIVQPDLAVFGQKDAQQARLVEQMTRDLDFPVQILVAPTVREPDGLAMSSRNAYLSAAERAHATCLYRALRLAEQMVAQGGRDPGAVAEAMRRLIAGVPGADIEYVEIVDHETLQPAARIGGRTLVALCVRLGRARLIDNTMLEPPAAVAGGTRVE
jgi:pantoate--beta-alanine ligase